ncbi:hypothetical protein ES332_A01G146600v1 [Gossypium tomentosum]|uniref:Homeobox domain-containing protein n=1 Tax=Gossypium tomentosum TaxID=34277 RepID=A0A5D2RRZ8_GOSTO|nr:hypothetical protein ES332_A01G146600v1 [Gossypium tomentosum]
MGFDDICSSGLGLGLGWNVKQENFSQSDLQQKKRKSLVRDEHFFPSLTLGPSSDDDARKAHGDDQQASSVTALSSFSNSSVKKEGDVEFDRVSSRVGDEDYEGCHRKKLRLTKYQSAILEDSFKEHTTLCPKQKQALAAKLDLRPRQVEVWFQNRRARTKLKQTEVDCELLKKCCETLTEENKRLQEELQELKSWKLTASYFMQLPAAATLTMCPSCERVANGGDGPPATTTSIPFTIGPKSHFINSLSHPSAAC